MDAGPLRKARPTGESDRTEAERRGAASRECARLMRPRAFSLLTSILATAAAGRRARGLEITAADTRHGPPYADTYEMRSRASFAALRL